VWGGHKAHLLSLADVLAVLGSVLPARCIGVSTAPLVSLVGGAGAAL